MRAGERRGVGRCSAANGKQQSSSRCSSAYCRRSVAGRKRLVSARKKTRGRKKEKGLVSARSARSAFRQKRDEHGKRISKAQQFCAGWAAWTQALRLLPTSTVRFAP